MKGTLLNTFLVAAGLLAGTMGAWAEDTETKTAFTQDFTGESTSPSDYGFTPVGTDGGTVENGVFSIVAGGNSKSDVGYEYRASFTAIPSGNVVTFSCDWSTGSATGTRAYSEIYLADASGNKIFDLNFDGQNIQMKLNGTVVASNVSRSQTFAVTAVVDMTTQKVRSLTVGTIYSGENIEFASSAASEISVFGFKNTTKASWKNTSSIDNVSVTYEEQTAASTTYTINYKCGETIVSTTEAKDTVGAIVSAQAVVYDENNVRYLIVASETPSITLAASDNVLDVPVRKPYTATLNITTTIGETSTVATTNLEETDDKTTNWSYVYSAYVNKDGVYYVADNTESFGETGTFADGDTINKTVKYSTAASDVVYFREAESAVGSNMEYSGGASGYVGAQNARNRGLSVGELPAGTYQFAAVVTGNNKRSLVARRNDSTNPEIFASVNYSTQSATFTLTEVTSIIINGANSGNDKTNQSEDFDYVLIKRVATDATLTITSAGYATFASAGNVTIPDGVTAYTATVNESNSTITLTTIASDAVLPAGTGLLVAGKAGDYTFTGTTADASTLTDNSLKVAGASTTADGTQYGLALVNNKVGFHKITSGTTIKEGKAYLEVSSAAAAKISFFSLDGEVTGINEVEANGADNGAFYTLQGVKTAKTAKGLYIYKGRKVIVK